MKQIMAVYDVDPFYADRFAEFVNRKGAGTFSAVAFTSLGRLREFAEKQTVELLLVGDEVKAEELEEIPVRQVIRLGETGADGADAPVVYKFQASDNVLREVMAHYQAQEPLPVVVTGTGRRARVVSVYSPVGRCGKTSFAMTLGQVLSRTRKTLFLTLEELSGFCGLTGREYQAGLTELLYYYRQGQYSHMRLGSVVHSWGDLDYVPPMTYPEDLAQLPGEVLAGLVEAIAREGIYEEIVVDLGHFFWGAEMLLAISDVIYTPVKPDSMSGGKLEDWRKYLERSGRGRLWQRIRMLKLPAQAVPGSQSIYLEQLLWGEMGDFVRSLTGSMRQDGETS